MADSPTSRGTRTDPPRDLSAPSPTGIDDGRTDGPANAPHVATAEPSTRPAGSRKWLWAILALLVLVGGGGGYYWFHRAAKPDAAAQAAAQASSQRVPVQVAQAKVADLPLYLNGLGTVQAFNTVTVRPRVDGEIIKIAFTEGETVKEGDLLAQIDPRPYQAALDQAVAKKAQDEATLANSKSEVQRTSKLGEFATRQQLDAQRSTVSSQSAQIDIDQAAIDTAQTQLGYATIRAPITGRTGPAARRPR